MTDVPLELLLCHRNALCTVMFYIVFPYSKVCAAVVTLTPSHALKELLLYIVWFSCHVAYHLASVDSYPRTLVGAVDHTQQLVVRQRLCV